MNMYNIIAQQNLKDNLSNEFLRDKKFIFYLRKSKAYV